MTQTAEISTIRPIIVTGIQKRGIVVYNAPAAEGLPEWKEVVIASNQRIGKQVIACGIVEADGTHKVSLYRIEWIERSFIHHKWVERGTNSRAAYERADALEIYRGL